MDHIPWVEKYRPSSFDDIVLEETNKILLNNIIEDNNFPNLLFYGPPGTGKTTTIINLIGKYQKKYNQMRKGLKIHLNASDDRGIDIIRNQINTFVNTKILFGTGMKFIILDEVDYMTKNAQQALRYLIQQYHPNIRFCLICNYISRIDSALQNEFIRLRFCNLPEIDIFNFLSKIVQKEKININDDQIKSIQYIFKSDIRSMINFLQSNHATPISFDKIITNKYWEDTIKTVLKVPYNKKAILSLIENSCMRYNIDIINYIKNFINYLIKNKEDMLTEKYLSLFEFTIHNININTNYLVPYFFKHLEELNRCE